MDELQMEVLTKVRTVLGSGSVTGDEEVMRLIIESIFKDRRSDGLSMEEVRRIAIRLFHKIRSRLGILQPLLDDEMVTEIMVNGPSDIFIERQGSIERYELCFDSTEEVEEIMRNIAAFVHREINEMNPIVDARLADGSRVNCVYKNIALNGPVITIRKFSERYMTVKDLADGGTLTVEAGSLLGCLVACGYNIFISGGTSTRQDYISKCTGGFHSMRRTHSCN